MARIVFGQKAETWIRLHVECLRELAGAPRTVVPDNLKAAIARAAPPAARNLALAHHLERLVDRGVVADYTQAARVLGVSQPRTTHLMGLLLLSPAIQDAIRSVPGRWSSPCPGSR